MSDATKNIQLQVIWSRLISAVEEQARSLIRAGFSTSTREAGDVSAGVFNRQGDMIAQAVTGTPGHINSMARSVRHFLDEYPIETMQEGDAFITNDPWKATGHLTDLSVVTPIFRNGRAVALFACTTHVVDIGGNGPSPESRDVYGEGLFIPIMKIVDRGEMNEHLLKIVRANVKEPIQVEGDIFALVACNDIGGARLQKIMDEYRLPDLETVGAEILARSKQAMMDAIAKLPRGTWRNHMRIDGYEAPIDLHAAVTVDESGVHIDLEGTSPASRYGINCPMCYTEAYAAFGVKCLVAPGLPNNAATLGCITVTAPEDCIANASFPRPVVARSTIGMFLPDLVFGCFEQAIGNVVPAESTGTLWNIRLGAQANGKDRGFMVTTFHSGGAGARPHLDGLSATPFPSGIRNVPVEVTEAITSLVIWKKEFRQDSGGAGQHRGGLGQTMVIGNREDAPLTFYARYERVENAPKGRNGGQPGATGRLSLGSGSATVRAKGIQTIPEGDTIIIEMPGGGGHGDPNLRDPEAVASDVALGYVSPEAARAQYGVAVDGSGKLDRDETARLRAG
ncbi:MAG: hydantoinase B/oxoprolinase family protein [Alphaproteobacteria bacterium]|nr:hydantoinase B/oxoprolinase family protein [Rhizobiaceae bacterium]MBU3960138.1 hydantoinase B/oxoprolinase family protein [Alphaproteobacteria bacterium]MBU4051145.1 hydantoinase B/oxoprolinase family protein [Alphaproteobacteria bacterium]MBU4090531.1 hydantoinase B/oxoprolinase family protein [Alphaproteobacteria bacterium]MBU4155901.1 hydantoinase B/oxoprolinase family protein [Alphaproteobacteria bacterium]